jgi:D-alanyl-D-alanine carboxypeptidase/D-alanyl-D-alanine-endopeptidase (penicillin-binding protein 4)
MRLVAILLALCTIGATDLPTGTRFGLYVATLDGREIVALRADERFVPASNTKIFTTIAAFEALAMDGPDAGSGAAVRIDGRDVVLVGHGDARLSSADDCVVDCLATLADAVAARTRVVRDVIGDDSAFPDERWSPGMSWNNIATRSGAAVSALTLDDNEAAVTVAPGSVVGDGYYVVEDRVTAGATKLSVDRAPNTLVLRVSGTIKPGSSPVRLRTSVDDPAHRAAWRLAAMLRARGVRVTGKIGTRHRASTAADDPKARGGAPVARVPEAQVLARVVPGALREDLVATNKASQNLHAELLLRRVGAATGSGSIADGLAAVEAVATRAGVARAAWDLSDGSGMSTYNRVSPRGMVTLLRWAAGRPWGEGFRDTLPLAGVNGTLRSRFHGTLLEGRLSAKTGTLNAANALAGYLTTKSGATLVFAAYAGDMARDASATAAIDAALVAVAEAN